MYQIKDLTCKYEQHIVFQNISVQISKGQYLILLGANGQGKSTFIDLITGFKQAESGTVLFEGQELSQVLKDTESKHHYYARLGILFQDVDMQLFNQTVYDEIAFGLRQLDLNQETIRTRVKDVLKILQIEDLERRVPYQLSGGEKKKVAFASILVMNPDIYVMDEPFTNLAKEAEQLFKKLFMELHQAGKTIILSTHHFKHVFEGKSDVLLFQKGNIRFFTASEVEQDEIIKEELSYY